MDNDIVIKKELDNFIDQYINMDIEGLVIPCPYWSNKIKDGAVSIRGFLNGKGTASKIRAELIKKLKSLDYRYPKLEEYIIKFSRRNRIGIDCSGFAYRMLNKLVKLFYKRIKIKDLNEIFQEGINKTSADMLTHSYYTDEVVKIKDMEVGDVIRMMGGKHVMVILKVAGGKVVYVHSSKHSKIQGVHLGEIIIRNIDRSVEDQKWVEMTRSGEDFFGKYFNKNKGDGVKRLKVFK